MKIILLILFLNFTLFASKKICYNVQIYNFQYSKVKEEQLKMEIFPDECRVLSIGKKRVTVRCGCYDTTEKLKELFIDLKKKYKKVLITKSFKYRFKEKETSQVKYKTLKDRKNKEIENLKIARLDFQKRERNLAIVNEDLNISVKKIDIVNKDLNKTLDGLKTTEVNFFKKVKDLDLTIVNINSTVGNLNIVNKDLNKTVVEFKNTKVKLLQKIKSLNTTVEKLQSMLEQQENVIDDLKIITENMKILFQKQEARKLKEMSELEAIDIDSIKDLSEKIEGIEVFSGEE